MTTTNSRSTGAAQNTPAIGFFGKMLTFTRLSLTTNNLDQISEQLEQLLGNKTSEMPVVIDSDVEQDLSALVDLLWDWGLQPIGVVTGILDDAAREKRLAIFPADGKRIGRIRPAKVSDEPIINPEAAESELVEAESVKSEPVTPEPSAVPENKKVPQEATAVVAAQPQVEIDEDQGMTSRIYDQMLRSGQTLNHVGGDLVFTNSINHGAEAITDNSLHVYGRAQGRLVAGATGDEEARIFCLRFNPSLVSVAGTYCLSENIPDEMIDKPVQVRFQRGQGLIFELLDDEEATNFMYPLA